MSTRRIRARVASARPLSVGYVEERRLIFHKRGRDGSAKADALFTGVAADRVWGVVFSIRRDELPILDRYEAGYDLEEVTVSSTRGIAESGDNDIAVSSTSRTVRAITYVANRKRIDPSLKPFSWYHGFVMHGAREHGLPAEYLQALEMIEAIADTDHLRHKRNLQLICV